MLEKLCAVEKRFEEVSAALCDGDVMNDMENYRALMKEHKSLFPVVEKFREYKFIHSQLEEAKAIVDGETDDREFLEMARVELEDLSECEEKALSELKILLLPRDENDGKNVIVEIRGGAGGEEGALFAGVLFRMY